MKVRCCNCQKVFNGGINSTCPKCFEILKSEDDFEILEDEQNLITEQPKPQNEITLSEDAKNQTKRILECVFWITFCLFIIISAVFTAVNFSGNDGAKNVVEKYAKVYESQNIDDLIEILPQEYIDYKTDKIKGDADFKTKLQQKLDEQIANYASGVGENYRVEFKINSQSEYTKDEISTQKNLLPYKIEREIKKMKNAEITISFKGNKTLIYKKTLLLAEIENKWYLLNADNQ